MDKEIAKALIPNQRIIEMSNEVTLKEQLKDWFDEQSDSELIDLHNSYCQSAGYDDNMVYYMEDLFSTFFCDVKDVYRDVICQLDDDFRSHHNYARFNGYGNVESETRVDDWVDVDDIISHIIAEDDDLGNSDIREILTDYEYPEDDEENEE